MYPRIFLFCFSLILLSSILSLASPKPVFASYLGGGLCDEAGGPGPYPVPIADCQSYGGLPDPGTQNRCYQGDPGWTFEYVSGCKAYADTTDPFDDRCDSEAWRYQYDTNSCNTEDRCWGSSTGASGFDAAGRIWPGICSASSYDPDLGPNSACISGGHYKQCCTDPAPGYTPATYCSSGICPAGYKTASGDTACDDLAPTPTDVPPEPTSTPVPVCIPTSSCPTSPPSGLSPNGVTLTPRTTVTLSWNSVTNADWYDVRVDGEGASIVAGQSGGDTTNNCTPHTICKNEWRATSMQITVQNGKSYNWWVHAGGSDGCQKCGQTTEGTASFGIGVPPPTITPTPIPTITPTATPTLIPDTNSINSPSSITKKVDGTWPAASITGTTAASGYKAIVKQGSHTAIGDCDDPGVNCIGWDDVCTGLGSGSYSCSYILGSSQQDGTYTYALFNPAGAILATSRTNYVLLGATPTTVPSGCTLTVSPSTVGPGGGVSVDLLGPAGTYMMTCPDGSTRGPGSPSDPWFCSTPVDPGSYTVSASGPRGVSCSAGVTVISGCDEELDGSAFLYIQTYKDTYWNNTNYLDLNNQWPHRFWCPDSGSCTYGTATGSVSDAKRNDSTYCGYSTKSGAGTCRAAIFPVCTPDPSDPGNCSETLPGNYSSRYPFNQPLGWYHTWLPNVVIHAENRCESYTGITNSSGQVDNWRNSFGDFIGSQPPGYIKYDDDTREYFEYDVWADVPSGRRFIRGNLFYCRRNDPSCAPAVFPFHESEAAGPYDTPRFDGLSRSRTLGKNVWFGFTNPGREPVCTGLAAVPESGLRPLSVDFTATGYDRDGTIVGYDWDFIRGGSLIDRSTTGNTTNYTYNDGGQKTAQVYLRDNIGLQSFPTEACQETIDVMCRDLTIIPNPVTMAPDQTQPLTVSETDGDPEQIIWKNLSFALGLLNITGASGEVWCTMEDCDEGCTTTEVSCSNPQAEEQKARGSWINIRALKEGAAGLEVSEDRTPGCSLQKKNVLVSIRIPPWFQGTGGDMRIDAGFNDPIPNSVPNASRYASLEGSGNTPGIIFSGSGSPSFGAGQASKTYNWVAGGLTLPYSETFSPVSPGVIRTSYSYMSTTAKQSGITPTALPCTLTNCTLPVGLANGVYKADGDTHLNAYTFPLGKNYVILINGNLFLEGNIIVPQGSTATFSVSGDIIVDKSIGQAPATACDPQTHVGCNIEGFYSADGDIIIQGNGAPACATSDATDDDKRVNFAGAMVANAKLLGGVILNQRDLCGIFNATYPTYTITERPDFIINAPEFIKSPNSIWQEVAP